MYRNSVVKTVAQLDKNLARIQEVGAAESKTVVEQHAAIGDVETLNVHGKFLAKALADGEVERCVRLKVAWRRAPVGEAGGIGDVGRSEGMEWEIVMRAEVQGIALVVIEEFETVAEGEVCQAAVDVAEGEGELVRIGQVNLGMIAYAGRAERELPTVDARALNGDGEKQVGVVEIIVVEEIHGASEKIVGIERPAVKWNGDAKLVLFVAFPVKRNEAQILIVGGLQ